MKNNTMTAIFLLSCQIREMLRRVRIGTSVRNSGGIFVDISIMRPASVLVFWGIAAFAFALGDIRGKGWPCVQSAHAAYREPASGRAGAVAADHEQASRAGAEILAQGGNAVDAAVATALALGVVQPAGSGLGGGGFLVFRRADGSTAVLDFREVAPKQARPDMFVDSRTGQVVSERSRHGGLAVAVPGEAAGFALALRELGTMSAAQVVRPAARLAREGFPVGPHLAKAAAQVVPKLPPGDPLRRVLSPSGAALLLGEVWRRPELAKTLDTLGREGFSAFYKTSAAAVGAAQRTTIGDDIVRAVAAADGILNAEDLRNYQVQKRQPLEGQYAGWRLYTAPPPAGGITAVEALQILDARRPFSQGSGAAATQHEIIEAFKHSFADRVRYHGDPAFDQVPIDELASQSYAKQRAATVQADRVQPKDLYGRPVAAPKAPGQPPRDHGTSHICVIDKQGNAAALTTTVNLYFGARLVAGSSGVLLNNEMDDFAAAPHKPNAFDLVSGSANSVAPGKRPASSMSPLIAVAPDGRVLCVGGSGGPTIVTGVVQTVVNVIDFQMSVEAAVSMPRLHAQFIPETVEVEPDVPADVRSGLQQRGHKLVVGSHYLETAVQAVLFQPGVARPFSAASDPRKGGFPALP